MAKLNPSPVARQVSQFFRSNCGTQKRSCSLQVRDPVEGLLKPGEHRARGGKRGLGTRTADRVLQARQQPVPESDHPAILEEAAGQHRLVCLAQAPAQLRMDGSVADVRAGDCPGKAQRIAIGGQHKCRECGRAGRPFGLVGIR